MHDADPYETMSIQNGEKYVHANTNFLFYNYMYSFL